MIQISFTLEQVGALRGLLIGVKESDEVSNYPPVFKISMHNCIDGLIDQIDLATDNKLKRLDNA